MPNARRATVDSLDSTQSVEVWTLGKAKEFSMSGRRCLRLSTILSPFTYTKTAGLMPKSPQICIYTIQSSMSLHDVNELQSLAGQRSW